MEKEEDTARVQQLRDHEFTVWAQTAKDRIKTRRGRTLEARADVNEWRETSLMVQWLRILLPMDSSSIPGLGRSHLPQVYVQNY